MVLISLFCQRYCWKRPLVNKGSHKSSTGLQPGGSSRTRLHLIADDLSTSFANKTRSPINLVDITVTVSPLQANSSQVLAYLWAAPTPIARYPGKRRTATKHFCRYLLRLPDWELLMEFRHAPETDVEVEAFRVVLVPDRQPDESVPADPRPPSLHFGSRGEVVRSK